MAPLLPAGAGPPSPPVLRPRTRQQPGDKAEALSLRAGLALPLGCIGGAGGWEIILHCLPATDTHGERLSLPCSVVWCPNFGALLGRSRSGAKAPAFAEWRVGAAEAPREWKSLSSSRPHTCTHTLRAQLTPLSC